MGFVPQSLGQMKSCFCPVEWQPVDGTQTLPPMEIYLHHRMDSSLVTCPEPIYINTPINPSRSCMWNGFNLVPNITPGINLSCIFDKYPREILIEYLLIWNFHWMPCMSRILTATLRTDNSLSLTNTSYQHYLLFMYCVLLWQMVLSLDMVMGRAKIDLGRISHLPVAYKRLTRGLQWVWWVLECLTSIIQWYDHEGFLGVLQGGFL